MLQHGKNLSNFVKEKKDLSYLLKEIFCSLRYENKNTFQQKLNIYCFVTSKLYLLHCSNICLKFMISDK